MIEIILNNEADTNELGKRIAYEIVKLDKPSIELHLEGELGTGKTFLARSIIANSGWSGMVKSPTYTLCEEYDLVDSMNSSVSQDELIQNSKLKEFQNDIFVFTPKGDLIELPKNATPVDFAFQVHTQIGLHCMGAKINHSIVPLNTKLKNGDMVEIITGKKQMPSYGWQKYIVTSIERKTSIISLILGTIPVIFSCFSQSLLKWHGPFNTFFGLIVWYQRPIDGITGVTGLFSCLLYTSDAADE